MDFWWALAFFTAGFITCFATTLILCFWKEIYDVFEERSWQLKYFLKTKGLMK